MIKLEFHNNFTTTWTFFYNHHNNNYYIGTYKPADNKPAQCSPGAVILSEVFNQDGSDAPYLQPVGVNFNPTLSPVNDPDTKIPVYTSRPFFQLFNNYDCANAQLHSKSKDWKKGNEPAQYDVLLGGVSYFFKTPDSIGRLPIICKIPKINI